MTSQETGKKRTIPPGDISTHSESAAQPAQATPQIPRTKRPRNMGA
jgi:hypothetical protein